MNAWKASTEPKKDRQHVETKHYVPAETPRSRTQAGLAADKERRIARDVARDEKIVLSSSDLPTEKIKRIKAVEGALTVWRCTNLTQPNDCRMRRLNPALPLVGCESARADMWL